ncbi:NYN domain-containing protein [Oscillospiraceae bacterium NTUH-002-81]|nr:NYN domain-containing protein [Oscillospiraceae bacterium NTUH-002-81]
MDNELRFAILIDADNISDKYIKIILDEISNSGVATYKRIYGDWTNPQLASWKHVLLENSIIPMQQYSYTTGKNSTDSAMIIDAMDILYSGMVDGYCIVSSDSDFTRLAARLRESGMQVIGMGEEKTPQPFISACNQFKYLDLLYANQQEEEEAEKLREAKHSSEQAETGSGKKKNGRKRGDIRRIRGTINAILEKFSDEDGWVSSGKLGDQLSKRLPDFDVRNYGFSKLTLFIKSLGDYEVQKMSYSNGQKQICVRLKGKKADKD